MGDWCLVYVSYLRSVGCLERHPFRGGECGLPSILMVKIYAVTLVVGIIGLLVVIMGGAFAENVGHPERDPGQRLGTKGKAVVGGLVGFGMGGMSAEFSPLDFTWPVSFLLALLAAVLAVFWVRYAVAQAGR